MDRHVDQAVYRVRKGHRKGDMPKGYRYTLEVIDDHSQQVFASCDVADHLLPAPAVLGMVLIFTVITDTS